MNKNLYDKLCEYSKADFVPLHMPGHKRNEEHFVMENPYTLDITEINGFDNLHHPTGILKESMGQAAKWYGADTSWFLVNGSSIGLMCGILAATKRGDKVLVARNCHVSVYNAILENELKPVYIYPEIVDNLGISMGITASMVEKALLVNNVDKSNDDEKDNIKAVIVTSPTYEGNVSTIKDIARICHSRGVVLIVDEAHGAHFKYDKHFPESALDLGADIVVQSLHKTLPAFTQTAIMHLSKNAVNKELLRKRLDRYFGMFQSTSPSYLLMASIDKCLCFMNSDVGKQMMQEYVDMLMHLRGEIGQLKNIRLVETDDISKIVICAKNGSLQGKKLYDILEKQYKIQLEMAAKNYCIAMTAIGDKKQYYQRFICALKEIDKEWTLSDENGVNFDYTSRYSTSLEIAMSPYQALNKAEEDVMLKDSAGRICAETICVYPPGIPAACPGEVIDDKCVATLLDSIMAGLEVIGIKDGKIKCLK